MNTKPSKTNMLTGRVDSPVELAGASDSTSQRTGEALLPACHTAHTYSALGAGLAP